MLCKVKEYRDCCFSTQIVSYNFAETEEPLKNYLSTSIWKRSSCKLHLTAKTLSPGSTNHRSDIENKASAAKGDELLQQILKIEGADRLGEAAIGTNYGITKFTKSMLFDEKMGGTIHMALGFNPIHETGGLNKSSVHWDVLKDMKKDSEIYADDKLIYKNGKFVIA